MSHIAILGYGRFGKALGELLVGSGAEVRAFDPDTSKVPEALRVSSPAELVSGARDVVVSVPVHATRAALTSIAGHLTPEQVVIDVGSVKVKPIQAMRELLTPAGIPWVATHPLFGPTSLALGERPLRVVICPDPEQEAAVERARALFARVGCELIDLDADRHDQHMAETHALAFFVAKGMVDAEIPTDLPVAPPSFQALVRTIQSVRSDAGHLFSVLHLENPYAAEARKKYLATLRDIDATLDARESSPDTEVLMTIPDLGVRSPELRETRDLIDELDRELIGLLGRRAELAKRARAAKKNIGEGVRDRARETTMLRNRRDWARTLGLPASADLDAIFQAILAYSRHIQEQDHSTT